MTDKKRSQRRRQGRKVPQQQRGVGYRSPPVNGQFKPGHSGNSLGRPKGSVGPKTILKRFFKRTLVVRDGGRTKRVPMPEAVLMRVADGALKGDPKLVPLYLTLWRLTEDPAPDGDPSPTSRLQNEDEALLARFFKRNAERWNSGDETE